MIEDVASRINRQFVGDGRINGGPIRQGEIMSTATDLATALVSTRPAPSHGGGSMSKGSELFNLATPRQWFQPGHDFRDIIAAG